MNNLKLIHVIHAKLSAFKKKKEYGKRHKFSTQLGARGSAQSHADERA